MFEVIQINLSHSNRLQQTSSMPRINWLSNDHLKKIQKFLFYLTFMNIETSPIFVFNYYCPMDENYCMTISIWTMNQNYIIHFILLLMLCLICSPLRCNTNICGIFNMCWMYNVSFIHEQFGTVWNFIEIPLSRRMWKFSLFSLQFVIFSHLMRYIPLILSSLFVILCCLHIFLLKATWKIFKIYLHHSIITHNVLSINCYC